MTEGSNTSVSLVLRTGRLPKLAQHIGRVLRYGEIKSLPRTPEPLYAGTAWLVRVWPGLDLCLTSASLLPHFGLMYTLLHMPVCNAAKPEAAARLGCGMDGRPLPMSGGGQTPRPAGAPAHQESSR